jgi:hypothetical protein
VTISQTWSTTGTYTAAKIDVTETATAAAASLLFDLQIGGARRLSVRKNGLTYIAGTLVTPNGLSITSSEDGGNQTASFTTDGVRIPSQSVIGFTSASSGFGTLDTILLRDGAANTLALRNSTAAQTFNVYGTYTSGTSYERLTLSAPSAANAIIGTNKGSGGGTARGLEFQTDGVTRLSFNAIGQASFTNSLTAQAVFYFGPSFNTLASSSAGVVKIANVSESDFNRLQFGGTSASFPALKRSTTTLQARLADDSAFAPIQGKLTTDTAYTGTVVAATGYITIYDSTGTAYRVPCAV